MQDLFSIKGKVALITGGSRGIGFMIAQGFVEAGAKVYITARKANEVQDAHQRLSRLGECVAVPGDISTLAGCQALADFVSEREPALHILVNNAGANWAAPMAEFPDEAFDKVMNTNVKGVFHLTRLLVERLAAGAQPGDPARVINIGSVDGLQAPALDTFAYSASKAAVHHMTRVLAHKLAPRRITVNAIAPGPFESKMMAETLRRAGDAIARGNPLGRIGEPEDMAGTAIFLSSRASAYITGTVIPVDGGSSTRHQ
ncbi:MAG: SDR family oxidoreductase [Dehalococcoidia bacterium]|nr:SDR family oxidoreductase [Dehalococcoidia bacterium]